MKVLTVSRWFPSYDSPGSGSFVRDLVTATAEAGVDARVVSFDRLLVPRNVASTTGAEAQALYAELATPEAMFVTPPTFAASGAPLARLPVVHTADAGHADVVAAHRDALEAFLAHLVHGWRPDVIHAHTGLPGGMAAAEVGAKLGVPVVVTEHASTVEEELADPETRGRYRRMVESAARVVTVSPPMSDRLGAATGLSPDTFGVLPNPIPTEQFTPLDTPRSSGSLLYVGSLGEHKGPDLLLHAFVALLARRPELRLTFVGGDHRPGDLTRLRELAEALGVASATEYTGWAPRAEIAKAMRSATVLVHPSPSETFGVVAAEAILSGLPVACRRSGGVPFIIETSGGFGAVAEDDSVEAFVAGIEKVLDRDLSAHAESAHARMTAAFGAEAVARQAIALYESVGAPAVKGDHSPYEPEVADFPRVVLATARSQASRWVPGLRKDLRDQLVVVAPFRVRRLAPDALSKGVVRLVEVDLAAARERGRRRAEGSPRDVRLAVRRAYRAAVQEAAELAGVDPAAVEVVAVDAAAARLIGKLPAESARLAPHGLRTLADRWDAVSPAPIGPRRYEPASYWGDLHKRDDLSTVGQSALSTDLNKWLYRALEKRMANFLKKHRVLPGATSAFDVGAGTGYWVRAWHRLGVDRVDGCDLVPEAVDRLNKEYADRGDEFVTADLGAVGALELSQQYDFVSVVNVLLHVTGDSAFANAVRNVAGLVGPGGHLLMVEPALYDASYARPVTEAQHSRTRTLAAYVDPFLAEGLEVVAVAGAVALANNPIEGKTPEQFDRYKRWWGWVAKQSRERPASIRAIGPAILVADRLALARGAAPSSKFILLRRGHEAG